MSIFHAPATVLQPDDDTGELPDVDGFRRAWTLADGTAIIDADDVTGGTRLRTDDELDPSEQPAPDARGHALALDRVEALMVQARRALTSAYGDEDGTLPPQVPARVRTLHDNLGTERGRSRDERTSILHPWPDDSVRKVLRDHGEDPDRLGIR